MRTLRQPRHFRAAAGGASYGYNDAGNGTSIKHPDGIWFGAWHDALGQHYYVHANNILGMAMLGFAAGRMHKSGKPAFFRCPDRLVIL